MLRAVKGWKLNFALFSSSTSFDSKFKYEDFFDLNFFNILVGKREDSTAITHFMIYSIRNFFFLRSLFILGYQTVRGSLV